MQKYEKFVGTLFFPKKKTCAKRKMDMKKKWLKNEVKDEKKGKGKRKFFW